MPNITPANDEDTKDEGQKERIRKMNIEQLKKEYIEELTLRNFAPVTIEDKNVTFKMFIEFLTAKSVYDIEDVIEDDLLEYKKELFYKENRFKRKNIPETINKDIRALQKLFLFARKRGYIRHNTAEILETLKEPRHLPKCALTDKEIKKILRQPDIKTLAGYRNRTILEVLYTTGMRNKELRFLKLNDLDLAGGLIRINLGKGRKDRIVPVGDKAVEYLKGYIEFIRLEILKGKQSEYLFINRFGKVLSKKMITEIVKEYAKRAGIKKEIITPHTFRRSCATELIRHKVQAIYVSRILGHSSLRSIQPYCDLTIMDLKKAHEKCHPRG